jgi:hypothetical protein
VANTGQLASDDVQAKTVHGAKKSSTKGKRIDERMAKKLLENPNSVWWTADHWASQLKCTKSTVHGTPTWEKIMTMRKAREAERATKHKSYKPADMRRTGEKRSAAD